MSRPHVCLPIKDVSVHSATAVLMIARYPVPETFYKSILKLRERAGYGLSMRHISASYDDQRNQRII